MLVKKYEDKIGVEHHPVILRYNSEKAKWEPKNYDFRNFLNPALIKRLKKLKDTDIRDGDKIINCGNTYNIHRIDIDNLEIFNEYFSDLDYFADISKYPQYLSRNKRLPHIYVKFVNIVGTSPIKGLKYKDGDKSKSFVDLLIGQSAWYKQDEKMINEKNEIPTMDFSLILKHYNAKHKMKELANFKKESPEREKKKQEREQKKQAREQLRKTKETAQKEKNKGYDINKITELLNSLREHRYNVYEDWIKVGIILHQTADGNEEDRKILLTAWKEFSKKSKDYNENELISKWESFKNGNYDDLTLGTLYHMAREDNPINYTEDSHLITLIEELIDDVLGIEEHMARLLHHVLKDKLVCAEQNPKPMWFWYENGIWTRQKGDKVIRIAFTKHAQTILLRYYENFRTITDDDLRRKEKLKYIINTCGRPKYVNGYITQMICYFGDDNFLNMLNSNRYLFCFGKYSYDLKKCEFRETLPTDFCSIRSPLNMEDINDSENETVVKVMRDIFPDEEEYYYFLNNMCQFLCGANMKERFYIYSGTGANGKGCITTFLKSSFGDYFLSLSNDLITSKRTKSSCADPELAKSRYTRILCFSEPQGASQLNNSFVKELSGRDLISCRELYRESYEFLPQFKIIIQVNTFSMEDCGDNSIYRRLEFHKFRTSFIDEAQLQDQGGKLLDFEKLCDESLKDEDFLYKIRGSFMNLLIKQWEKLAKSNFKYPVPKTVLEDKKEFINDSNIVKTFIDENIEKTNSKNDFITLSDLYEKYRVYCKGLTDEKPILKKKFLQRCSKYLPEFKERHSYYINGLQKHGRSVFLNCRFTDSYVAEEIDPLDNGVCC